MMPSNLDTALESIASKLVRVVKQYEQNNDLILISLFLGEDVINEIRNSVYFDLLQEVRSNEQHFVGNLLQKQVYVRPHLNNTAKMEAYSQAVKLHIIDLESVIAPRSTPSPNVGPGANYKPFHHKEILLPKLNNNVSQCKKCNMINEYADYDPNYICYNCK